MKGNKKVMRCEKGREKRRRDWKSKMEKGKKVDGRENEGEDVKRLQIN